MNPPEQVGPTKRFVFGNDGFRQVWLHPEKHVWVRVKSTKEIDCPQAIVSVNDVTLSLATCINEPKKNEQYATIQLWIAPLLAYLRSRTPDDRETNTDIVRTVIGGIKRAFFGYWLGSFRLTLNTSSSHVVKDATSCMGLRIVRDIDQPPPFEFPEPEFLVIDRPDYRSASTAETNDPGPDRIIERGRRRPRLYRKSRPTLSSPGFKYPGGLVSGTRELSALRSA